MAQARARTVEDALPSIENLSVEDLTRLIAAAEKAREGKLEQAKADLRNEMRNRAAELGIDLESLMGQRTSNGRQKRSDAGQKLPVKFRGPNGETYTGRGPTPRWLKDLEAKGKKREDYLVR